MGIEGGVGTSRGWVGWGIWGRGILRHREGNMGSQIGQTPHYNCAVIQILVTVPMLHHRKAGKSSGFCKSKN